MQPAYPWVTLPVAFGENHCSPPPGLRLTWVESPVPGPASHSDLPMVVWLSPWHSILQKLSRKYGYFSVLPSRTPHLFVICEASLFVFQWKKIKVIDLGGLPGKTRAH